MIERIKYATQCHVICPNCGFWNDYKNFLLHTPLGTIETKSYICIDCKHLIDFPNEGKIVAS
ncbi:hypothetical protein M0R19_05745 [Candidatus Pacearchaeota archaeon]|nr:hypothetical protein [Candidatus Pacearchaeota archaeon]